tara:strand:- start:1434 stop:1847 length:414 start_codon:yes stop_codon:yes gene_type:complete
MAYGSNSPTGKKTTGVTHKGFSSRARTSGYKLYDFEVAKQDLINRLSVRKGERVENPEFGTIIYDAIFEPLTESLKDAILDDLTTNFNADERLAAEDITVLESDHGITVQVTVKYRPLDITEKLRLNFDENQLARLS